MNFTVNQNPAMIDRAVNSGSILLANSKEAL